MRDLARLAIAAFGAPGRGLGRDRRRRAAHPPRAGAARRAAARACRGRPAARGARRARRCAASRRTCAASSSATQIERTEQLPPARPLNELDRALPSGPLQDLAAVHRVVAQLKRRLATQGHEPRGRAAPRARRRAPHDARVAADRRRAGRAQVPPAAPAAAGDLRAVRRLDARDRGLGLLPLGAARAARLVPQAALVRLHRAHLRGDRRSSSASATSRRSREAIGARRRRRRHLRLHRLRARVDRVPRPRSRTTCTRARR